MAGRKQAYDDDDWDDGYDDEWADEYDDKPAPKPVKPKVRPILGPHRWRGRAQRAAWRRAAAPHADPSG